MIGRIISHYRILEKLGQGGMGVVYKAEHLKLRKIVALKFLRPDLLEKPDRRARFVREARAAASLDHTNICPVYDFDEVEGQAFMAMAYVEGSSLRERIEAGPLPLQEALQIADEVAAGLAEAHGQGLIHRDIKPSNIKITADGQAKILDFGLVQFPEATQITDSGHTVGTTSYMSPEQATGKEVDRRTDIWSLGVVLYEMVTGQRPFQAETDLGITYAVVHEDPRSVRTQRPEAPAELVWIINKMLAKDPGERYQDLAELRHDLHILLAQSEQHPRRGWPSWVLENRGRLLLVAFAFLAMAAAIFYIALGPRPTGSENGPSFGRPVQVTSEEAWEGDPCLSPDGSRVVYSALVAGNYDIFVSGVGGGRVLRLTQDPAADRDPTWLPDGSGVLFTSLRDGQRSIWQVDQMGGGLSLLVPNASDPAVSPHGDWLAFSRADSSGQGRIFIAPMTDHQAVRQLTWKKDGPGAHRYPAWSPDQQRICYTTDHNLWVVAVADGGSTVLTAGGYDDDYPVWSPSGRYVYFNSRRENTLALWRVDVGDGQLERLTYGSGPETHPSLDASGARLTYSTATGRMDEDVFIVNRGKQTTAFLSGEEHDNSQPAIQADGSLLAFVSDRRAGKRSIWTQQLREGQPFGEPQQLTDQDGNACHPNISRDGRWIAYYLVSGSQRDIWIVSTQGGPPRQISDHTATDLHPAWSPTGRELAFASDREGNYGIWVVGVEEGKRGDEPRRITPPEMPAMFPVWSPAGDRIAFIGHREGVNEIYIVPVDGSQPARQLNSEVEPNRLRWRGEGDELWVSGFEKNGIVSLRIVPLDGSPTRALVPPVVFGESMEYGLFDTSDDGSLVVFSRPKQRGNIWVLVADSQ
ncbi:MAG: protein kinase [bacterium]